MNQSAIDIEFLTESGADHYIESVNASRNRAPDAANLLLRPVKQ